MEESRGLDDLVKDWPPQYKFLIKEFLLRKVCMSGPTCLLESPVSQVDPLTDFFVHGITIHTFSFFNKRKFYGALTAY